METYQFSCPNCGASCEYSIWEDVFSPVEVTCYACHSSLLLYLLRGIVKPRGEVRLRAFVPCSIWGEDKGVIDDFRERLFSMGITPRTVGVDSDIKARNNEEALVLAKQEINKAHFIVAIEVPRYYIDGFLPSIWTIGIEPGMASMVDKPIYVFKEVNVKLEGPLPDVAEEIIEFDRNLLSWEAEDRRINQWLQEIERREKERRSSVKSVLKSLKPLALIGAGIGIGILIGKASNKK
jgi:hypothetical protein